MSSSLYVKDPAATRFIAGTAAEAESLLGSPLPLMPPPDRDGARAIFAVRFHPQLHLLLDRFLQSLLREIGGDGASGRAAHGSRDQADYEAALSRVLRAVRANDRRLGLVNLFWVAHSRAVAESLRDLQQRNAAVRQLKYSLHPLLSSFYRRLDQAARRSLDQADGQRAALLAGAVENASVVDAIIEDGFAFTEMGITNVDFNQFLAANKRYRLTADLFFEIYTLLLKETDRRLRENERGMVSRVARHLPGLGREQSLSHSGLVKVMMNAHVLTYLLGDAWQTGSKLLLSARIKAEAERRRPAEIVDAFLDVVAGVKRFEIVSHLRDQVCLLREGRDDDRVSRMRLYEFGESAQVLNNAVNATVLFLDLRGFTQTSEGQISERDLTRELYDVFDAFVPHIRRFGGTVDKFLGDGIMVTYGTTEADPLHPLNALRSAILCQETLRALRQQGKTYFKMGVAIHYGRVYLARFIADEWSVQSTVIGRNVNMAGRLSSAAKKALDEDEAADGSDGGGQGPEFQVTVDPSGVLFNEGIAISRDTLGQLEAQLPLTQTDIGGYSQLEYFDEQVGRRILIRYAGDAKFKGVRSSVPVYSVEFEG